MRIWNDAMDPAALRRVAELAGGWFPLAFLAAAVVAAFVVAAVLCVISAGLAIALAFQGSDRLFVPHDQLEKVTRRRDARALLRPIELWN